MVVKLLSEDASRWHNVQYKYYKGKAWARDWNLRMMSVRNETEVNEMNENNCKKKKSRRQINGDLRLSSDSTPYLLV
jgi:hypothetical protein